MKKFYVVVLSLFIFILVCSVTSFANEVRKGELHLKVYKTGDLSESLDFPIVLEQDADNNISYVPFMQAVHYKNPDSRAKMGQNCELIEYYAYDTKEKKEFSANVRYSEKSLSYLLESKYDNEKDPINTELDNCKLYDFIGLFYLISECKIWNGASNFAFFEYLDGKILKNCSFKRENDTIIVSENNIVENKSYKFIEYLLVDQRITRINLYDNLILTMYIEVDYTGNIILNLGGDGLNEK